jgi:oxalate decarboxylase family bicupin protein
VTSSIKFNQYSKLQRVGKIIMMWQQAFTAAMLLAAASAAPAGIDRRDATPTEDAVGPPEASGSLRGGISLAGYDPAYPTPTKTTQISKDEFGVGLNQEADPDLGLYIGLEGVKNPQPFAGKGESPTDPGPRNQLLESQNPSLYVPPETDSGDVPNGKWPLGLSHNRHGLSSSGYARQQNTEQLPIASAMAGVDMRLEPNAYRELHWHKANEWALVLNGSVRLNAINEAGATFNDNLQAGDVWFFPAGIPHSIQASQVGCEFLLVFDDGSFSEDGTSLVSELFERNPKSVLAKNFRTDTSAFDNIPEGELYIFNGTPYPTNASASNITGPAGVIPQISTYSYHLSQQEAYEVPGGSLKIIDPQSFPVASNFAAAVFTIKPGAMRELHWHTTSDEWNYIIGGQGRLTVYVAPEASRTYDFQAGDVGYIPVASAHYLENTGDEDLVYVGESIVLYRCVCKYSANTSIAEILQAPIYNDISVAQWLGLTPRQVVKDHLGLSEETLERLPQVKPYILPGDPDLSKTNFTETSL